MITRFPGSLQMPNSANPMARVKSTAPELRVLSNPSQHETESVLHEEDLAWIHWLFQSARIRNGSLIFISKASRRHDLLVDWESFANQIWLPILAPVMLQCWQAANENRDAVFVDAAQNLNQQLPEAIRLSSIEAGHWLLQSTEGAKYQGALGRLRQQVADQRLDPHLPIVWAAIASLFQLPAPDLLIAIIREEWRAGCPDQIPKAEPKGRYSFGALVKIALRNTFQARHAAS